MNYNPNNNYTSPGYNPPSNNTRPFQPSTFTPYTPSTPLPQENNQIGLHRHEDYNDMKRSMFVGSSSNAYSSPKFTPSFDPLNLYNSSTPSYDSSTNNYINNNITSSSSQYEFTKNKGVPSPLTNNTPNRSSNAADIGLAFASNSSFRARKNSTDLNYKKTQMYSSHIISHNNKPNTTAGFQPTGPTSGFKSGSLSNMGRFVQNQMITNNNYSAQEYNATNSYQTYNYSSSSNATFMKYGQTDNNATDYSSKYPVTSQYLNNQNLGSSSSFASRTSESNIPMSYSQPEISGYKQNEYTNTGNNYDSSEIGKSYKINPTSPVESNISTKTPYFPESYSGHNTDADNKSFSTTTDGYRSSTNSERNKDNFMGTGNMFKKKVSIADNMLEFQRGSNLSQPPTKPENTLHPNLAGRKFFPASDRSSMSPSNPPKGFSFNTPPINTPSQFSEKKVSTISKDDFVIGKKLGKGRFGDVFLAKHKSSGFVVALKLIQKSLIKSNNLQNQLARELKVQCFLKHQNVAALYGFFADAENVYLILELCTEGQLYDILKEQRRLPESEAVDIICKVVDSVDYLQRQRVIHRDIKPQNIILQYGVPKLCDFGWAVYSADGFRQTFCGTPSYAAPELLQGHEYDDKIDVWAIGILTYEILVGRIPFKLNSQNDLTKIIKFPEFVEISDVAKEFITNILKKNPEERYDIDEIMNHRFLKNRTKTQLEIEMSQIKL